MNQKEQKGQMIVGTVVLVMVVVVLMGVWFASKTPAPEGVSTGDMVALEEGDWLKGNPDAPLWLVEYGDFQCPACAYQAENVMKIIEEFPNKVSVVYRHFPLEAIHANATPAARAAEAAGMQGKFWEMHDLLYEHQGAWSQEKNAKDIFVGYAQELGLNRDQFLLDYENSQVKDMVRSDLGSANKLGLNSTPTFFLNGNKIQSPASFSNWKTFITSELEQFGSSDTIEESLEQLETQGELAE